MRKPHITSQHGHSHPARSDVTHRSSSRSRFDLQRIGRDGRRCDLHHCASLAPRNCESEPEEETRALIRSTSSARGWFATGQRRSQEIAISRWDLFPTAISAARQHLRKHEFKPRSAKPRSCSRAAIVPLAPINSTGDFPSWERTENWFGSLQQETRRPHNRGLRLSPARQRVLCWFATIPFFTRTTTSTKAGRRHYAPMTRFRKTKLSPTARGPGRQRRRQ